MNEINSPILETRDLQVAFGTGASRKIVISDIDIQLQSGQTFGLIGESGCGKSTVLRSIAGLNPLSAGEIRVGGVKVPAQRSHALLRRMQLVFQDPYASLHPRKTVEQILLEPVVIHRMDNCSRRVDAVLDSVGLQRSFRYRYPHQLSGGQRQRIAVARALIVEPEILLLDEPTSALDVSVQAELLNLLKKLHVERGLTYLMVSHDFAVIAHICERVAVMNGGRIVEILNRQEIREGNAREDYTRKLFEASRGYRPRADTSHLIGVDR